MRHSFLFALLLPLSLSVAACADKASDSGSHSTDGADGADGADGSDGDDGTDGSGGDELDVCHWDAGSGAYEELTITGDLVQHQSDNPCDVLQGSFYIDSDGDGAAGSESPCPDLGAEVSLDEDGCPIFTALTSGDDCDDDNPAIHPDAPEPACGDTDLNCDGVLPASVEFLGDGVVLDVTSEFTGTSTAPSTWTQPEAGWLEFCPGTYYTHIVATDELTIMGNDAILDGGSARSVVTVNAGSQHVWLHRLTVQNGSATNGGGLSCSDAELRLDEVTVVGNTATGNGGGIWASECEVRLEGAVLDGNRAGGAGGAIWSAGGELSIDRSTVHNSVATGDGGAVWATDCEMDLRSSTIEGSVAGGSGGGVYSTTTAANTTDHQLLLIDSFVQSNTATGQGGGVFVETPGTVRSLFWSSDTEYSGNAAARGGAIYLAGYLSADLEEDVIQSNTASELGGGVMLEASTEPADDTPRMQSEGVDWGTGATNNGPEDVVVNGSSGSPQAYLNDGTVPEFHCDHSGCADTAPWR